MSVRIGAVWCLAIALHVPSMRRANFVRVEVTAPAPTSVRAIWRPRAGVIGTSVDDQQRALGNPLRRSVSPDSLRRWRDVDARDTVIAQTPTQFVIDMTSTDAVIEVVSGGTIRVKAQLVPGRGPIVELTGRAMTLHADGTAPMLTPRR